MIGICGFLRLDRQPASRLDLERMRAALPRSGVPSFAGACDGPMAIGLAGWHACNTVEAASWLYRHADSGCLVVADARLQHREALARSLDLPPTGRFSDAQLIAHAWLRFGPDCSAHLDGDFVFAVWDPRRQSLYCARDIMGVRPLYVHHTPGRLFAFASQAGALLQLPDIPGDLDEGRIADALINQLEPIDKTSTFYKAIKRLPPAHWVAAQPGNLHQRRYWELAKQPAGPLPQGDAEWSAALADTLDRVVRRHLASGHRIGCMLSGGMDSSSLAVIARDQLIASGQGPLPTFSSIDNDPGCAETRAIRAVLAQPGFAPTLIGPDTIEELREQLEAAGRESDEPFDASMYLLHAQYLMASRQGIDAVMDGIDADVLLTDSGSIARQIRAGQWMAAWRNAQGLQRMYPGLPAWKTMGKSVRGAAVPQWLRAALWNRRQRRGQEAIIDASLISREFAHIAEVRRRLAIHAAWSPPVAVKDARSRRVRNLDHPNTTVGFERYHRVASRHGVVPLHPFDDRELLELCVHLPDGQCLAGGWTKAALRRAMQGRLPDAVCWRTGKEHLGWSLIERLALSDTSRVRERLDGMKSRLAAYVDIPRLESAAVAMADPANWLARSQIFEALNLGQWLESDAARQVSPAGHNS